MRLKKVHISCVNSNGCSGLYYKMQQSLALQGMFCLCIKEIGSVFAYHYFYFCCLSIEEEELLEQDTNSSYLASISLRLRDLISMTFSPLARGVC